MNVKDCDSKYLDSLVNQCTRQIENSESSMDAQGRAKLEAFRAVLREELDSREVKR